MARGGAHFSSEELAQVLSHYDIGVIHQLTPVSAGNKRAPKVVVISEKGKYFLKRRPKGKNDEHRVAFAHAVQTHLAQKSFPVTKLIKTRDQHTTILQLNHHIYELFQFVTGVRYDGSAEATIGAGRHLAWFHLHLADFHLDSSPMRGSFHDSSPVRRHLKAAGSEKAPRPDKNLHHVAAILMTIYNQSSVRVSELGFDSWPKQVVHGDWHPGNMLFHNASLVAVLDFDSTRVGSAVTDLANGMLQFSIVGGRPNPANWPAYLDQTRLVQFLNGYRDAVKLKQNQLKSLLDLMVETMIAEAILPIAATSFFGTLSGADFLKMIRRKVEWINKNRTKLADAILA